MKTQTALLLWLASISTALADPPWFNVAPIYSGPVTAKIDFQMKRIDPNDGHQMAGISASYDDYATNLWVNIRRAGLSRSDVVHVMIINYFKDYYRAEPWGYHQETMQMDLTYAEAGRFTGRFPDLLVDYLVCDGNASGVRESERQEIVIWINGHLYKGNNGQNLPFNIRTAIGCPQVIADASEQIVQ